MKLGILTFNWHEPYLCLLSELGYEFVVVEPEMSPGRFRHWDRNMRPIPENVKIVSLEKALADLDNGSFDLAIAHNVKDLIWLKNYSLPKIAVFHNRLKTELGLGNNVIDRDEYLQKIGFLLKDANKVFISESKRDDWGLDGSVILPGINMAEHGGYEGSHAAIFRVGNLFKERDVMLGYSASQEIIKDFPCITLGLNPSIPESRLSRGFDDLKNHYRLCRLYLNTTVDEYEDGYNLSMLEAMATGMPIISTDNKTSPIVDGINGFISKDIPCLRERVAYLLKNPEAAAALGKKARDTVQQKFPMTAFLKNWNKAIQESIVGYLKSSGVTLDLARQESFQDKKKKNILLDYVSYPVTTAHYMERALRKTQNVFTCGAMITPELIERWNLKGMKWEVKPQDFYRGGNTSIMQVMKLLPKGWNPDLYLWIETGLDNIPPDIKELKIPKACYLIDTHLHSDRHKEIARYFDFVFLAQKEHVEKFKAEGVKNVYWLPLGCDPEIHGKTEMPKKYDVGFVGSVTSDHKRRKKLLDELSRHFNLFAGRKFMEEMALVFSRSKIVFNNAINNDLNMRVFEALCSGSMLITDKAPGSGLEEMFEDGKHLVYYADDNLVAKVRYYLDHPDERVRIAMQGRLEALAKHTYDHRAQAMLSIINDNLRQEKPACQDAVSEKPHSYYRNVRQDILPLVPEDALCILDVGCGAGMTGKVLKERPGVFVAGLEMDHSAAEEARQILDDVVEGNIETMVLPYEPNSFDCIIMADVLEHLVNPLAALKKAKQCLKPNGVIIASIPNVQFFGVIHFLAEGKWTYQKEGILDEDHLRFFTFTEIEKLFHSAGLEISAVDETLDSQYEAIAKSGTTSLKCGRVTIDGLSPEEMRRFFVFQYKIVARQTVIPGMTESDSRVNRSDEMRKTLLEEAMELEVNNSIDSAMSMYGMVADRFHGDAEALAGLGNCHLKLGNLPVAEDYYRNALRNDPHSLGAGLGLALLAVQNGNFDDAMSGFRMVLEKHVHSDRALCGLGLCYYQKKDLQKSMEYFLRSLNLNIENKTAMTSLLNLSFDLGRFEEIERLIGEYLRLHPANLDMLYGLAGIRLKVNRVDDAREILGRILLFQPDHKNALQLLEHIEEKQSSS